MSNNLVGMYLSQVLGLMRESVNLKNGGRHWKALERLRTLIFFLALKEEEQKKFDAIVSKIDSIEENAQKINGDTTHVVIHNRRTYKKKHAHKIYNSTLRAIQSHLKKMGYYEYVYNSEMYYPGEKHE